MDLSINDAIMKYVDSNSEKDYLFRNFFEGEWCLLPNAPGLEPAILEGIRGRSGARAVSEDGEEVGIDMIEMSPGSAFPEHAHPGDHVLLVLSGQGQMEIDGVRKDFKTHDTVYVPAEIPHAVIGPPIGATEPLMVCFFSKPHKHLEDTKRMHKPHDHERK